jgi:hypothetical protein
MNNRWGWGFAIALVAIMVFLARWSGLPGAVGLAFKQGDIFQAAATVLTALLVITLFVERTMGVANALLFGDRQRDADINFAHNPRDPAAAKQLGDVLGLKERVRLLLSFAAGLFISAAGVRTMEPLLIVPAAYPNLALFHAADIVLTAGLIAGGSNGLAFLIELLKGRFTEGAGGAGGANGAGGGGAPRQARSPARAAAPAPAPQAAPIPRARLVTTS